MNLKLETAKRILSHLIAWGEIALVELAGLVGACDWLKLLESAGVVRLVNKEGHTVSWSLCQSFIALLSADHDKAVRRALYNIPEYRNYLIGILTEGITTAAKQDMHDQIEKWSGNDLLPFLFEINSILDQLESCGKRVIDENVDNIVKRFETLQERSTNWDTWNQLLLGRTGRSQELFDFVFKRFIPYASLENMETEGHFPVLLPIIPLLDADGNTQYMNINQAPWNTKRNYIKSSIALFDEEGKALSDLSTPKQCKLALQDALLEQPFYKATVHLAINAYRTLTASSTTVELFLTPGSSLDAIELFFEGKNIGALKELLPRLLTCQKYFSATSLTSELVGNMVENLLALEVLEQSDDNIGLHPDFRSTLMAGRLRTVFRPGKVLQTRMLETIKTYLNN